DLLLVEREVARRRVHGAVLEAALDGAPVEQRECLLRELERRDGHARRLPRGRAARTSWCFRGAGAGKESLGDRCASHPARAARPRPRGLVRRRPDGGRQRQRRGQGSRADRGERPLRERGVAALVAAEPRRGRRRRGWPVGRAAARARPPRARRRRRRGAPHRRGAHGEHGRAPPRPRARAGPLGRPRPGRAPCPRAARARPVGRAGADRARARVVPASRARAVPLRAPHGRPRRARPLAADRSPRLVAWARAAARVAGARTGYTRAEHVARSEHDLADVARRTFVATVVVLGVVVLALVLWKARLIVTLLFLAIVLASAMRSSVDALHRRGVPKAAGIGLHYA